MAIPSKNSLKGFHFQLERYENKYLIPASLVAPIREYIRPFCKRDPNGIGEHPSYVVTTLQLDSENFDLHYAKEREVLNRFKLRVRTYGEPGDAPVFLEVKRKFRSTISKLRVVVPWDKWSGDLVTDYWVDLEFRNRKEENAFFEFIRLCREIDARPKTLVRYTRECYLSNVDDYARVTFDTNLLYQPTSSWTDFGRSGRWIPMDTGVAQGQERPYSAVILELKCLNDVPTWMMDVAGEFNLVRTGNCKYATALWQDSLYRGEPFVPHHLTEQFPL